MESKFSKWEIGKTGFLILIICMKIAWVGNGYGATSEDEGVYRVNVSVGDAYPREESIIQISTFLDMYEPPAPGEAPSPLSPEDLIFIGDVSLRFEVTDENGVLVNLNISQDLRTNENGSLEVLFIAPENEGKYTMTVWALIEGEEYSNSVTFTVSEEARLEPTPSPVPGIQLEVSNLKAWTNGTISFEVYLHEYESQVLEEVHVNDYQYSWEDGSIEDATILKDENKKWRIEVGTLKSGDTVHVEVKSTDERGGSNTMVEASFSNFNPTFLLVAGSVILTLIVILFMRAR